MKSKWSLIILVICTTILFSCKYGDQFKTYSFLDRWQIDYPAYLTKTTYVFPGAEFQVKNGYRDTYMFTREFSSNKEQNYILDSLTTLLRSNLVDPRLEKDTSYTLNGVQYSTQYITGILDDKRMFYLVAVLSYEDKFYHFGGWMFNSKRELWEADFEKALHSWKSLK